MAQLLATNINTSTHTNTLLRNWKLNLQSKKTIIIREDEINKPEFNILSNFKDLILDLSRQVNACKIKDVVIAIADVNDTIKLGKTENRLILCLINESNFSHENKRYTPETGSLIWLDHELEITNNSNNLSLFLIIDFEELILK